MNKLNIGKFTIRTAKSLIKKLEKEPRTDYEIKIWYYLKGIYDTRFFGLVVYRTIPSCRF